MKTILQWGSEYVVDEKKTYGYFIKTSDFQWKTEKNTNKTSKNK